MERAPRPWTLILFTRWPEPGCTKTRLIPAYGATGAVDIHRQLIAHTARAARGLPANVTVLVALADAPARAATVVLPSSHAIESPFEWDASWRVVAQQGDDLGERMAHAIDHAFTVDPSCDAAVLVGVDCPNYSTGLFCRAANALCDADTTFAPTEDGGYGLVGVARRAWQPPLRSAMFDGVAWGSATVMRQTLDQLAAINAQTDHRIGAPTMLEMLWDIDHPADVERAIRLGHLRRPT
ncbi:MAG: glycosyltransferase [Betaproteobacteria bacterium]|nr:MAG: glycosyltransferase [Betaproteobacteria bacterium]